MAQAQHTHSIAARIREGLPGILPDFLIHQRWFGGKTRTIESAEVQDVLPIPVNKRLAYIVMARINYTEGNHELYAMPLMQAENGRLPGSDGEGAPSITSLRLARGRDETILHSAFLDKEFSNALLEAIHSGQSYPGDIGELHAFSTKALRNAHDFGGAPLEPSLMRVEQSNTSVRYGDRFILKFFRRVEEGANPDLEIGTFLAEKTSFEHTPPLCGVVEYQRPHAPAVALGILQAFVSNQGDAWRYTLSALESFLKNKSSLRGAASRPAVPALNFVDMYKVEFPADVPELIGNYRDSAGLLGRRTAQLHLALASDTENPDFRPEPFSSAFQRSQWESMRELTLRTLRVLEKRVAALHGSIQGNATKVLRREAEILSQFEVITQQRMTGKCIRIHGDYHLGQVLYTGSDFVIIDFEGEPARPLEERRRKRSPIQDVAGMLRSFHYAAYTALDKRTGSKDSDPQVYEHLESWAQFWQRWVSARFLGEYLSVAAQGEFLPRSEEEFAILLKAYLLEKAIYELGYELNTRPDWVRLPLEGILQLVEPRA
jgi:maltose alpha-D-glucosyltransferase / alpha-amylase